ncbi:MAG TPA: ATP-binding protein, partial [Streptomyces sp.]|nr:ATP-binding protein [Streptomyces sp.]
DSWGMRAQNDGSGKVVWFTLPVILDTPLRRGAEPGTAPALPALAAAAGALPESVLQAANGGGEPAAART